MKLSTPAAATTEASVASLGDLSAYAAIVSDVQAIAAKGDLVAAEKRATDLEALWDQNAVALQAKDGAAWGVIDCACDTLFHALRAASPDATAYWSQRASRSVARFSAATRSPLAAMAWTSETMAA